VSVYVGEREGVGGKLEEGGKEERTKNTHSSWQLSLSLGQGYIQVKEKLPTGVDIPSSSPPLPSFPILA